MNPTPPRPADGFRDAEDLAAPADPILVRLFKYWQSKRGNRLMPSRADIDPTELRSLVYNVMLYDVVEPGAALSHPLRRTGHRRFRRRE
jgi:hypothetical protein